MSRLVPVDRLEVQILVENLSDTFSSTPAHVEHEHAGLLRRGVASTADFLCCAVHGLSCLVTAHRGASRRSVLFDCGPEPYAFDRNVTCLGIDLATIDAVVHSHGHWDHCGAMPHVLATIRARNGGREVPYYAHPGMFRSRAVRTPDGALRKLKDVPGIDELTGNGASMVVTIEPQTILDGMFYVSGEIPRVTPFERGLPGQVRRTEDGTDWEDDELTMDERYLAVHVRDKGVVVLSACSHAGIINVLSDARAAFPAVPLHTALGGLHLAGSNERIIPETVDGLRAFDLKCIAAGHCTGWRAIAMLHAAFGDKVLTPMAVGKRYTV